jgi:hypothetical protein
LLLLELKACGSNGLKMIAKFYIVM